MREAVQTVWFTHLIESAVVGGRDFSFGRVDAYLVDYFDGDTAALEELFAELYIHVTELSGMSVVGYRPKRIVNAGSIQYITLGGPGTDPRISRAALAASVDTRCKQPSIVLRWSPEIDEELMGQSVKSCASGFGYPAFFDERKLKSALMAGLGADEATADDFALYGCDNITLPGREDELREVWINAPFLLLRALDNAPDSLDELLEGFRHELRAALDSAAEKLSAFDRAWCAKKPFSFESLLASHAVARGETVNGAGADFKHFNAHLVGMATLANSLYAVDKLVFREKRFSAAGLSAVLAADWAGHEALRLEAAERFEKFGNDEDGVDTLAVRAAEIYVCECAKTMTDAGRRALPAIYSLSHHRAMGGAIGATPDGRRAGEALSESLSGVYGTEKRGPTASLCSAAKLPLFLCASGGNNLKLTPKSVEGKKGEARLRALIEGYFELGGSQLQINVLDHSVLLHAVAHPERHRDLLVRVVGYSAYFVLLSPDQQREIIARNSF